MKNAHLFLFCGGLSIDSSGGPKPLMKIHEGKSLIKYYLEHLESSKTIPDTVTLLCDVGQKKDFLLDLSNFKFPIPIQILESETSSSTFDKFLIALKSHNGKSGLLHFSYPDIFFFGDAPQPDQLDQCCDNGVAITVTALTSRFPRIIVDIYSNVIKGMSDHTGPMPANPMHVFGGDLWGRNEVLRRLSDQFLENNPNQKPSLEHDLFFWLINQEQANSLILFGDWLLVDSARDVRRLLNRLRI
jgi:hypothetical protein